MTDTVRLGEGLAMRTTVYHLMMLRRYYKSRGYQFVCSALTDCLNDIVTSIESHDSYAKSKSGRLFPVRYKVNTNLLAAVLEAKRFGAVVRM